MAKHEVAIRVADAEQVKAVIGACTRILQTTEASFGANHLIVPKSSIEELRDALLKLERVAPETAKRAKAKRSKEISE